MKTSLKDKVEVKCFVLMAEVGFLRRRPELQLLCREAQGTTERAITPALVQKLLPGLHEMACRNLIRACHALDLCTLPGTLRPAGLHAAATGEVQEPEQGRYLVWIVHHPVTGTRVLHIERDGDGSKPPGATALPFVPETGRIWTSAADLSQRFVLRKFLCEDGGRIMAHPLAASPCAAAWDIDFLDRSNLFRFEGNLLGLPKQKAIAHAGEPVDGFDYDGVARDWARGRHEALWDPARRKLAVPFLDLTDGELQAFVSDLPVEEPEFRGHRFPRTELKAVPLMPRTPEAARKWSLARLARRLGKQQLYRGPGEVRRLFAAVVRDTPLEPFSPSLPAHEALVGMAGEFGADPWLFRAPVDLSPHEVPAEFLRELTVGIEPASNPLGADQDGRILFGLNEPRVMNELVLRLAPKKEAAQAVLICDRYVRGTENLKALELFCSALRQAAPDAKILVLTRRDLEDTGQSDHIERITGLKPRFLEDVYGPKGQPHSRYVLVRPRAGQAYAWSMTDSPLNLRIPSSGGAADQPLPGPELHAFRLDLDQVPGKIRRVFGEMR